MLCDYCTTLPAAWLIPRTYDIAEKKDAEPEHWWTHPSWLELKESAQTCELCALIFSESIIDTSGPFKKTDKLGVRFNLSSSRIEIWCQELNRKTNLHVGFDLKDVHRAPERARNRFDCRPVSKRVGNEGNIRTIKRWIQVCETHEVCGLSKQSNLPTRVLDIGTSDLPSLRLHSNPDEIADFVALSYCWGGGNSYTTTKATLQDFLSKVDFDKLPITLQDTVTLTRQLGYKYLWVDALCIVQDDREDWAKEASNMHNIYAQAKLIIAADMSPNSNTSLLTDRSARHNQVVAIPWPYGDCDEPLNLYITPIFKDFKTEMANSFLSKRGWCYQERALGTRILHMGEDMCFWECKEACIGEDDEITKYSVQDGFFHLKDLIFPAKDGRELTTLRMHDKWSWVIQEFTKRHLTFDCDRFAALEGVTTLFASKGKLGKHLCGLWENDFLRHLLWHTYHDGQSNVVHRRPAQYRAPTWSWASVEGPVKNPYIEIAFVAVSGGLKLLDELGNDGNMGNNNRLTLPMLTIQNIHVQMVGKSEYGSVNRAHIQASGILVPIVRGMRYSAALDLLHNPKGGEVVGGATFDVDDRETKLWICPVMMCKVLVDGMTASEGLVLKAAGGGEGRFERVAKARVKNFFFQDEIEMKSFMIL